MLLHNSLVHFFASSRVEYRALEGFVLAVSPFNFTAIGGNLPGVPALVGNVVVWKPSPAATYSNYLVYQLLAEAGVPAGVIQFIPGPPAQIVQQAISHRAFAALHFTGSTAVFRQLWKDVAANVDKYRGYPRLVGETGGKNFHVVHRSADVRNAVLQTVRGAFEYQGQKCSACSRVYVSREVWEGGFKEQLLQEVAKIRVGPPHDWSNFMGPVMCDCFISCVFQSSGLTPGFELVADLRMTGSWDTSKRHATQEARSSSAERVRTSIPYFPYPLTNIVFGAGDDSKGYFIQPTVILSKDPKSVTFVDEIFGPVVSVYVFEDVDYEETLALIDETTEYALTGAM